MKLWVLTNEYAPYIIGGLGVVATNLTKAMAGNDQEIIVLAKCRKANIEIRHKGNVKIIRFPRNSRYYSIPNKKFCAVPVAAWLKKHGYGQPDFIHIHSLEFAALAGYYKRKYEVPVVYTCHSLVCLEPKSPLRELVAKRQEKLLEISDGIVVPSQWEREQLEEIYSFSRGKVEVIRNGVRIADNPRKNEGKRNRLLFVGRLIRSKGIEELLQAVALLRHYRPEIRLDVVGTGSSLYMRYLKGTAAKLGISGKVRWLGYMNPDVVQKLYSSYGAVVVPSRQESFGLVALEALANGVPLVSTCSGGLSDFVSEHVAELIPKVETVEIAAAIRRMWKQEDLTKMRVEIGLKIATYYEWAQVSNRYRQLFFRIYNSKNAQQSRWKLDRMWKDKLQGSVWVVEDDDGNRGYFKFTEPQRWYYSGTMVANEMIAARLAQLLEIPVVELEQAEIADPDGNARQGIVSREHTARELISWQEAGAKVRSDPRKYVKHLDSLQALVVFDAWIMNVDRATGKNLILYRNEPHEKYDWYLIDHGLALFGSPSKWAKNPYGSAYWGLLWQYYHVPKGLLQLQSSPDKLEPMIRKIESIRKSDIVRIVRQVPERFLPVEQRDFTVKLLTDRQKQLRGIIRRWLNYKGTKEYATKYTE